jgi:hypothetical protein
MVVLLLHVRARRDATGFEGGDESCGSGVDG